ncbi:MAG: DUF1080 domain-containing protein [Bacteroidota bacterium]
MEIWQSLFNGKDLTGWTLKVAGEPLGTNYKNTIRVEDSLLRISYDDYENFDEKYGHLYYEQPYSHYKLRFDYRFVGEQTPGGATWNVRNSGIMLHSQSAAEQEYGQHFPVSIEIQLLGGLGEDKGERTTANLCTPGTAVVMGDTVNYQHCINSSSKTYHGDQWISVEAVVLGDQLVAHLIEGDTVLAYQQPQIGGGFIYAQQTKEDWQSFGIDSMEHWIQRDGELLSEGYIALQAESHPIDFKNIELLNLKGCMDKKAKNYKSYYVEADNSQCSY